MPNFENVLYTGGLKVNLTSISQLCDRLYKVSFSKRGIHGCWKNSESVMKAQCASSNCYGILQQGTKCTSFEQLKGKKPSLSCFEYLIVSITYCMIKNILVAHMMILIKLSIDSEMHNLNSP